MLWVIDGLVYGFFTAIYTLFNQHYKLNGYVLGIWRGFGISLAFMPFLYFFPVPESAYYWFLLIFQGLLIGVYDSHLFFRRRADVAFYGDNGSGNDFFMVVSDAGAV